MAVGLSLLAAVLLWPRPAAAETFRHHRNDPREQVLRSAIAPSNGSSNWIVRTYTVPGGSSFATFEYDYLCSGGSGVTCASEYSTASSGGPWTGIDSLAAPAGGLHQSGHVEASLPTTSSTIWVRFRYDKASSTAFQDGLWIDDVWLQTNTSRAYDAFSPEAPLGPEWTAGGSNGGFFKRKLPAARALGPSEDMGKNTTITIQRDVSGFGNGENSCVISYATDTAATHKLKVWESSILRMDKSGKAFGTESIALTNSSGTKTLKIEYVRDGSPTGGTNLVRIDGISCYTAGGTITLGHWDFDGQTVDSAPYEGWTQSCAGSGCGSWLVVRSTPHQSYVPMQTFSAEPFSLDGLPLEYKKQGNPTSAPQFDAADPAADPNPLWLFATSSALHVYWRFHAQSPGVMGEEQGDIYVLIDNKRAMTLQRVAECNGQGVQYQHPAKTDRFIAFSYALSSSQQEGSVAPASITQLKGDCNGGWAPLAGGDLVANLSAYLYDSGDETLGLEMVLDFYGAMASDQLLGLGLRRDVGGAPREALPFFEDDGVVPPDSTDAHSWETLRLFEVAGLGAEPTEREDGCCFAPLDDLD